MLASCRVRARPRRSAGCMMSTVTMSLYERLPRDVTGSSADVANVLRMRPGHPSEGTDNIAGGVEEIDMEMIANRSRWNFDLGVQCNWGSACWDW